MNNWAGQAKVVVTGMAKPNWWGNHFTLDWVKWFKGKGLLRFLSSTFTEGILV